MVIAMLRFCLLLFSLLVPSLRADTVDVELTPEQIWRYNNVLFQGSASAPVALALRATQNASTARDDDELSDARSSVDRILTGGVPLRSFDLLIATQLFSSHRFRPDTDAPFDVRFIVRDYQTHYQRVNTVRGSPRLANIHATIARRMEDIATPDAHVQLQMIVTHRRHAQVDVWNVRALLAPCQRLSGAQWLSGNGGDDAFWQTYSSTAIGQTVHASINYLVEQIYQRYSADTIVGEVIARRGERLQLSLTQPDVNAGDTVTLWHRDEPQRSIGHLRIKTTDRDHADAWPLDLHPASIALGDRVYVTRTPPLPLQFLPPPPLTRCEVDKNEKADDNENTTSE